MKRNQLFAFWAVIVVLLASSCQKQYERPDITLPTGSGGGGGTTGGTTGSLLIKAEAKTTGNTTEGSVTNYEWDANNRMTKVVVSVTDSSNNTVSIAYRFVRDASGRITKIISNSFSAVQPGAGFPDSIYIDVHYPPGSNDFDYSKYTVDFGGLSLTDSVAYKYSNGTMVSRTDYSGFSAIGGVTMAQHSTFEYANQNLTKIKVFAAGNLTTPAATTTCAYDSKNAALPTGNESFLPGMNLASVSKNNPSQESTADNTGSVIFLANYTFQYNADNYPVTGTITTAKPSAKTQNVKFTYK